MASYPARRCERLTASVAGDNAAVACEHRSLLFGIQGENAKSSRLFLKLYDQTAEPNEADVPAKTLSLPASHGFAFDFVYGFEFSYGLAYRLTAGHADGDAQGVGADDVFGLNLDYT